MLGDLLSAERLRGRGMFRPQAVSRYLDEHRSGRRDWSMQLWQFLTLEIWMQTFLDGGARQFESALFQSPQAATA
jgi:asparagine synthase (glutamine-hydrolysing)